MAVLKIVHIKDLLKCSHGGTVNLDPTEERRTEIKDDLRVVTDKDLTEKVTISGCSLGCTKIVSIQVGLAKNVELDAGSIPVLRNLRATTDKGCIVTWKGFELNIADAVKHLNANAQPGSIHYCAMYVQNAIRAGGIQIPGADATDFGPVLQNNGFAAVDTSGGYTPQTGDVVQYDGITGHPYGHTAMYNGDQWVSDFKQKTMGAHLYDHSPHTIYRAKATGAQAHAEPL